MVCVRVTGSADEIELLARSFRKTPVLHRRLDGVMAGYFEMQAPKVVCLDLGTTGTSPVEDEIVDIAIVDWAGNVVHEGKYRPDSKDLWSAASKVNGVAPDKQEGLPSFFDDQEKIREIIWGADEVIVYNAPHVMRFLEYNGAAPASGTRVTDTMFEYCRLNGESIRSLNCRARFELDDAASHIGYVRSDGTNASIWNALACLGVQKWIEWQRREEQ